MFNLVKKLLKGSSGSCCNIKIEEVKTEGVNRNLSGKSEIDKSSSCRKSGMREKNL